MSEHPAPTPDPGPVAAPPAAGAGRGLPGWAIALIAVGSIAVLGGFFALMLWLGAQERPAEAGREGEGSGRTEASEPHGRSDSAGSGSEASDSNGSGDSRRASPSSPAAGTVAAECGPPQVEGPGASARLSEFAACTSDAYLARMQDGTITDLVPGGDSVDPDYIGAFLFILSDYKSAARITDSFGGGSPEELLDLRQGIVEVEARFLAGEDLGTSVRYERADGSVFESDGEYRTID